MSTFKVRLNKLNELHTSLDTARKKSEGLSDQIYTKLNRVSTVWDDPNTEVFLKQIKLDQNKIDDYNDNMKKINNAISTFTKSLVSIARKCDAGSNGLFSYNGSKAQKVVSNCQSAYSLSQTAKNRLDYVDIPSTFKYRSRVKNMKYQIMDINDRIKKVTNDLDDVITEVEKAFNTVKNISKVSTLTLKQMEYTTSIQSVDLVNSSAKVSDAKAQENLTALSSTNDYNEQASTFQNISQTESYSEINNNFEENDSTFVNLANRTTTQDGSLAFDENTSTFTNNSAQTTSSNQTVNIDALNSVFNNTSTQTTATDHTNDFAETTTAFAATSATDAQSNNINISNTNNASIEASKTSASNANINVNTTQTFSNSVQSQNANNTNINIDKL